MSPDVVLVLSCLGLGLLIAYVMWASVRTTLFQLDLLKIVSDLDAAVRAGKAADDPMYQATRVLILIWSRFAPYTSLAGFLIFFRRPRPLPRVQSLDPISRLTGWGQTLPEEVRRAWLRVLIRTFIYFMTSPIDVLVLLAVYASGRSEQLVSWFTFPWVDFNQLGRYNPSRPDLPPRVV